MKTENVFKNKNKPKSVKYDCVINFISFKIFSQ